MSAFLPTTSPEAPASADRFSTLAMLSSPERLQSLVRFAELMSTAVVMVPKHLHGKPADCLAIVLQAARWNMDPFAVAQKTHLVNGTLGYEAQLILAVLQQTQAIKGAPRYEYRGAGADLECRVGMILAEEPEERWTNWLRNGDVKTKNSPLWTSNPSQQLGYLQVKFWARQYAPGAILGLRTQDELEDLPQPAAERFMGDAEIVAPAPPAGPRRRTKAQAEPVGQADSDASASAAHPVSEDRAGPALQPEPSAPAPRPTQEGVKADPPQPQPSQRTSGQQPEAGRGDLISSGQVAYLTGKLRSLGVSESSACERFDVASLAELDQAQFAALKSELLAF